MTGEVVNLNTVRKAADRARKRAEADANAARHGRTKAEGTREEAEAQAARRKLDGHLRDPDAP